MEKPNLNPGTVKCDEITGSIFGNAELLEEG